MFKKLGNMIKCFFGKHDWVDSFFFSPYCKHCFKETKGNNQWSKISLTGFQALRKDK